MSGQTPETPLPAFARSTDPTGFWTRNREDADSAIRQLRPDNPSSQFDVNVARRQNQEVISWKPVKCKYGELEFDARLSAGAFAMPLEPGGLGAEGQLMLQASKAAFLPGPPPQQHDEILIWVGTFWKVFHVASVSYQFDVTEDAIMLTIDPEDAEIP